MVIGVSELGGCQLHPSNSEGQKAGELCKAWPGLPRGGVVSIEV